MDNFNTYITISLIAGFCIGLFVGIFAMQTDSVALNKEYRDDLAHTIEHQNEDHDHSQPHDDADHSHTMLESQTPLYVIINATPDSNTTYLLSIDTNLEFAPFSANQEHIDGQGHAHVYVNGVKTSRIYAPFVQITATRGDEVNVVLSTNNHSDYTFDGSLIQDTIELN